MASYPQRAPPQPSTVRDVDRAHQTTPQLNGSPYHTKYAFEPSTTDTQTSHIHGAYSSSNQRIPYFVTYSDARPPLIPSGRSTIMGYGHDGASTRFKEPAFLGDPYSPPHHVSGLIKPQPDTPMATSSPTSTTSGVGYHHRAHESRHPNQPELPARLSLSPQQLRPRPIAHGSTMINQQVTYVDHPPMAIFESPVNRSPVRQAGELSQMHLPSLRDWPSAVPPNVSGQPMVANGNKTPTRRESLDMVSPISAADSKQSSFVETKAPTCSTSPEHAPLILSSPLRRDHGTTTRLPMLPPTLLPPAAISATQVTPYASTVTSSQVSSTSPVNRSPIMTPQRTPSLSHSSYTGSPTHFSRPIQGDPGVGDSINHVQGPPADHQKMAPPSVKLNDQAPRNGSLSNASEAVALGSPDGSADKPREISVIELPNGVKGEKPEKQIFECPGCDLTFTRLSALRQHMLSHTGEKPHACDHCGRRFSLASNLRRHTSTKACKVLKFQEVKEKEASAQNAQPLRAIHPPVPQPAPYPQSNAVIVTRDDGRASTALESQNIRPNPSSPPPVTKKRKASNNAKPTLRRKRHANNEPRWIPNTLRSFHNAHFLTSTAPFRFYTYKPRRAPLTNEWLDDASEPFTRPTLPLHPVRRSIPSRHRSSLSSSSSTSSSGSDGGNITSHDEEEEEERNSYDPCPEYPYHPSSWNDHWQKLPGPGLLGEDELIQRPSIARRWMSFKP